MGVETERKFLVCGNGWQALATQRTHIRQAYLTTDGRASVRVRIRDDGTAALTVKARQPGMRRLEFEYPIPPSEAESLIALRAGGVVEKVRHIVAHKDARWEVDVFAGENAGLVIAEIELRDEHQRVELPPWVGTEVTGRDEYYSGALAQRPFAAWGALRAQA